MGQTVTDPFEYAVREVRRGTISLEVILRRLLPILVAEFPEVSLVRALERLLEGTPTLQRWQEALKDFERLSYDGRILFQALDAAVRSITGWEGDPGVIRFPEDSRMAAHNLERILKAFPSHIDSPPYADGKERVTIALWGRTSAPWEG